MPRLGGSQSQSYAISSGNHEKSDLPRFERPVLKPARSSYSSERLQAMAQYATASLTGNGSNNNNGNNHINGSIASASATMSPLANGHHKTVSAGAGNSITSSGRRFLSRTISKSRSGEVLPTTMAPPPAPKSDDGRTAASRSRKSVRAAIPGRDHMLPDWSPPPEPAAASPAHSFQRQRTHSGSVLPPQEVNIHSFQQQQQLQQQADQRLSSVGSLDQLYTDSGHQQYQSPYQQEQQHTQLQMELEQQSSRVLRQRKPMEDFSYAGMAQNSNLHSRSASMRTTSRGIAEESPYRLPKPTSLGARLFFRSKVLRYPRCNLANMLQGIVALVVTLMLYDSHHKATTIAARLQDFKNDESMVFLHLHRIEQQSIQLHHALERLNEAHVAGDDGNNNNSGGAGDLLAGANSNSNNNKKPPAVDSALIQKQTQQLMQMEEELSHEVRTLQTRIQHSAVRSIVQEYGEGPVQVILEVEVDGQIRKISILLWHDTPHAAWSWLEQISRRLWDGAKIKLENSRIMGISAPHPDTETRLDFIEQSQQQHDPWTVGLTEGPGGGLEVFINLQDNKDFSKHNVCVGKVFDGFDVLHRVVEHSRKVQLAGGTLLTIRTARASHLTNRDTKGLMK